MKLGIRIAFIIEIEPQERPGAAFDYARLKLQFTFKNSTPCSATKPFIHAPLYQITGLSRFS